MSIPILNYSPSSQNQRVSSWEINGDEQPRIYTTDNCPSQIEINELKTKLRKKSWLIINLSNYCGRIIQLREGQREFDLSSRDQSS